MDQILQQIMALISQLPPEALPMIMQAIQQSAGGGGAPGGPGGPMGPGGPGGPMGPGGPGGPGGGGPDMPTPGDTVDPAMMNKLAMLHSKGGGGPMRRPPGR